jgi:hypothetical protein
MGSPGPLPFLALHFWHSTWTPPARVPGITWSSWSRRSRAPHDQHHGVWARIRAESSAHDPRYLALSLRWHAAHLEPFGMMAGQSRQRRLPMCDFPDDALDAPTAVCVGVSFHPGVSASEHFPAAAAAPAAPDGWPAPSRRGAGFGWWVRPTGGAHGSSFSARSEHHAPRSSRTVSEKSSFL